MGCTAILGQFEVVRVLTQDDVCHLDRQEDLPALTTVVSGRDPRAVFVQLPFHGRCGRLVVAVLALELARLILAAGHFARLAIFNMPAQQCRVGRRVKVEGEAEDDGEVSFERKPLSNRTWRALDTSSISPLVPLSLSEFGILPLRRHVISLLLLSRHFLLLFLSFLLHDSICLPLLLQRCPGRLLELARKLSFFNKFFLVCHLLSVLFRGQLELRKKIGVSRAGRGGTRG